MRNFPATGPREDQALTKEQVEIFRQMVSIGQELRCKVFRPDNGPTAPAVGAEEVDVKCIIREKYPSTAETTQGNLQWTLLALWNRDLVKEYERAWRRRR